MGKGTRLIRLVTKAHPRHPVALQTTLPRVLASSKKEPRPRMFLDVAGPGGVSKAGEGLLHANDLVLEVLTNGGENNLHRRGIRVVLVVDCYELVIAAVAGCFDFQLV